MNKAVDTPLDERQAEVPSVGSGMDAAARTVAVPFDNSITTAEGHRYLLDPRSHTYLRAPRPDETFAPGMLPPQELEVRMAIAAVTQAFEARSSLGLLTRWLRPGAHRRATAQLHADLYALAAVTARSPEHTAAAARIYDAYRGMPRTMLRLARHGQLTGA